MQKALKIILVDDNVPFRESLKFFIETQLHHKVIAEANNGFEFLELKTIHVADVVIMDLEMDRLNGYMATKMALCDFNQLKFIAMTMHFEHVILKKIIEYGFKACVFKSDIFNFLDKAIENAFNNHIFIPYKDIKIV